MADEDRQDTKGLAPPSLGAVVTAIIGAAAVLYPFGMFVFERQLELAYKLDPAAAWHAVSLVSQTDVIQHGLQVLVAGSTLFLLLLYSWLIVGSARMYNAADRVASFNRREHKRQQGEPVGLAELEAEQATLENGEALGKAEREERAANIAGLKADLSDMEMQLKQDADSIVEEVKRQWQIRQIARYRRFVARSEQQLMVEGQQYEARMKRLAEDRAILADLRKEKGRMPSLIWRIVESHPHVLTGLTVFALFLLVFIQDFKPGIPPSTSIEAAALACIFALVGIYCMSRHLQFSQGRITHVSQWLLWGVIFGYGSALISGYYSTPITRNGLLPFAIIKMHDGRPVSGGLLNAADGSWYIVVPPTSGPNRHAQITSPAQVLVIRDVETAGVRIVSSADTPTLHSAARRQKR